MHPCSWHWGDRDEEETPWVSPISLVYLVNSEPVRDPVSKKK